MHTLTNEGAVMSKAKKPIVTVKVSFEEYSQPDFVFPSKLCIRDFNGDFIFYKSSKRELVQQQVDFEYGEGMYRVREV